MEEGGGKTRKEVEDTREIKWKGWMTGGGGRREDGKRGGGGGRGETHGVEKRTWKKINISCIKRLGEERSR